MVNISAVIDHTLLKPNATYKDFKILCEQAVQYGFCSVCVPPFMVETCKKALMESNVKVCTVIGFPLGANTINVKVYEAVEALENGAEGVIVSDIEANDGDIISIDLSKGILVNETNGESTNFEPFKEFMLNILEDGGLVNHYLIEEE